MNKNKSVYILLIFALSFVVAYGAGNFLMKKITDNVIKSLRKEYVPGPYKPGFDPDKVPDLNQRKTTSNFEIVKELPPVDTWNQLWEQQRQ